VNLLCCLLLVLLLRVVEKDTFPVYRPVRDRGRRSKLILEKREDGRVVGKRQFTSLGARFG